MWCANPMVVDTWKADSYRGYPNCDNGAEADEDEDKVDDQIPSYAPRDTSTLSRSASCNRINLPVPNRKPKRSLSTSGSQRSRPVIEHRHLTPENSYSTNNLDCDPQLKDKDKLKRSSSVLTRLARQYSFSRSRRTSSSSSKDNMSSNLDDSTTTVVTKGRSQRRRRNKNNKKESKNENKTNNTPNRLDIPKSKGRLPSPLRMTLGNSHVNGEFASSPDSCPNSPPHFKTSFSISPPTPPVSKPADGAVHKPAVRGTSPISADDSPLPSPPLDDKSYDSGRMSMSSFRSFSSGRPTSMSSVTSSISSRTSRGSDYFSSASSTGQSDQQVTSYRLGLQTVLPDLDESDSVDRLVLEPDAVDGAEKNEAAAQQKDLAKRNSRTAAFKQNANLNEVDHLAPVANLAMVVNPDLSYVDRVILELLETERMYVRSLRDILTGYLAVIRSTPQLNIQTNDVDDLFGNIRDIYDFNRNLLGELEDCCGDPRRVAKCFVSKDEDFKVYTEYCTNYPSSVAAMTRCMKNPNLVTFFKVQQDDLRHTLPLGSYLLKPVQRILKYHLLLQELVKHCDKSEDGYSTIQNALQTMTRVARHINDMKRKHEDAVHIQEIQSLLTSWQGNELTTYGELILESEMRLQGAKNERQVFLFEKMVLITKRREDGYLVCKANIMCSNLVLLESIPNTPLGFQIQPFAEKTAKLNSMVQPTNNAPPDPNRVQRYILLAPTQEEKSMWTYHIKRLIIETMNAAVPLEAKKSIMRMRPVRDGDGDGGSSEEDRMRKKSKSRFGSSAILSNHEGKNTKSPLSRLTTNSNTSNTTQQSKPRRRSDSMSRKSLHKRALQKRKDEIESSDDISADSGPNTPSGLVGKFSFPRLRQSTRSTGSQQVNKVTTTQAQSKNSAPKTTNAGKKTTKNENDNSKKSTPNQNGEVVKRHHNSVIYRRHKRRTSQPITVTEKRLSMKLDDDETKKDDGDDVLDDDDLMNFNPLTARESVSWDIQIVEAVFERYKKEGTSPVTTTDITNEDEAAELGSTYLTVPSDVAPAPLLSLDHTPSLSERRKSRIFVVPSSDSSDVEIEPKKKSGTSAVLRRRKSKGAQSHRTSGVVYALSQDLEVESDSGLNETKAILRKVVQASESARKSLVIHESDTEAETNRMLIEKANTVRRKTSLKRRERNARRKNGGTPTDSPSKSKDNGSRRGSLYDNMNDVIAQSDVIKAAVTSSVQSMSTPTISMVDSRTKATTEMVTVQSSSVTSTGSNDVTQVNSNSNNNKQPTSAKDKMIAIVKDTKHIPTGKVRGLIERMWNSASNEKSQPKTQTASLYSESKPIPTKLSIASPNSNNNNNNNNNNNSSPNTADFGQTHRTNARSHSRVVTTASLPLTITSSSSSESDGEGQPTIAQRVKRLSTHDADGLESSEKVQNPLLFIRRTFSQEESNSNTRRSTNLYLEARMSGEFGVDADSGYIKKSPTITKHDDDDFKFEGVEDIVGDAKHYLFEKLCLSPPGETKITDKMSEEFEHVCSDLERSGLRMSSLESHAFSGTSDEDSVVTSRMEKTLRRELSPLVPKKEIAKISSNSTKDVKKSSNITSKSEASVEQPKIFVTRPTDTGSGLRKYGQQYGRSILPNRTDSIRSTRSEYTRSRYQAGGDEIDSRGRSAIQKHRNSITNIRLPSKDMQAIPQMNVARLAKQFSEISREPEKLAVVTPRRSRSVGGAARLRQRQRAQQERRNLIENEENVKNDATDDNNISSNSMKDISGASQDRKTLSHEKEASTTIRSRRQLLRGNSEKDMSTHHARTFSHDNIEKDISRTTTRGRSATPRGGRERNNIFEKAAVQVDEMCVCEAVDYSKKLQTASVTSPVPDSDVSSTIDDDVFPTSPKTGKKMSLIEMFAANPHKSIDEDEHEETVEDDRNVATENKKSPHYGSSPNVRVVLVPKADNVEGGGGLEPKVLNLSPTKEIISPPSLEKRKSWTKLSSSSDDAPKRTRLRSSSLTRAKRRALLASDN